MKHQSNEALSGCASRLDPHHPKGLGVQITPKSPKSGIFFKNLLVNYRAECIKITMKVSGACLDVKLCPAWRLALGKGEGAQGASPYFSHGHKNFLFSQTTRPIRINFGIRYQGSEALSECLYVWIRPCKAAGDK